MILLAYDGSADAQVAIDQAAQLMPGAEATVLSVWEPLGALARTGPMGAAGSYADVEHIDAASSASAAACATDGAERATAAGLAGQAQVQRCDGGVVETILAAAAAVEATLIVTGTRGRGGVKGFLLGSVSRGVVDHADRAVLVVPSPELVERRRRRVADEAVPA